MLGGDPDGRVYRAAVVVADRWCGLDPTCEGKKGGEEDACPLSGFGLCAYAKRRGG